MSNIVYDKHLNTCELLDIDVYFKYFRYYS